MTPAIHHPQVYPIEEDTLLLLESARAEVRPDDRVLEVGTGSGHVAASITPLVTSVVALDVNPHAVRAARALGLEVIRTDLLDGLRGPFDIVLFNPPYLPTSPEDRIDDWLEFALDGGPDGRQTIERFLCGVGRVLAPSGRVLILVSSLTGPDLVAGIAEEAGLDCVEVARRSIEGEAILILRLERRKSND